MSNIYGKLNFITISLLVLSIFSCYGQSFKKEKSETANDFITRIKPKEYTICHPVLENTSLISGIKNTIIAFYQGKYNPKTNKAWVMMYFYTTKDNENYTSLYVDSIIWDMGGPATINSVFYIDLDNNKGKEIAVLNSYSGITKEYGGDFYTTSFYKIITTKNNEILVPRLDKLEEEFYCCDCDYADGSHQEAKFKYAIQVRKHISKLRKRKDYFSLLEIDKTFYE